MAKITFLTKYGDYGTRKYGGRLKHIAHALWKMNLEISFKGNYHRPTTLYVCRAKSEHIKTHYLGPNFKDFIYIYGSKNSESTLQLYFLVKLCSALIMCHKFQWFQVPCFTLLYFQFQCQNAFYHPLNLFAMNSQTEIGVHSTIIMYNAIIISHFKLNRSSIDIELVERLLALELPDSLRKKIVLWQLYAIVGTQPVYDFVAVIIGYRFVIFPISQHFYALQYALIYLCACKKYVFRIL